MRASFRSADGRSRIADLAERGGYRLALPDTFAAHLEATLVNTGGGIVGGDRVDIALDIGAGADIVFTTPSAERIYRCPGPPARVDVRLALGADARLDWLPQQTILYAGAGLVRRIEADLHAGSRFLAAEIFAFGRPASREPPASSTVNDRWRVCRNGRLLFAETLRLAGDFVEALDRPSVGGGARASGLILYIASNAEDRLARVRAALAGAPCECGASAWNEMLAVRLLAVRPADMVLTSARAIEAVSGRPLPRAWLA
ncbi:MAG: urease accessory protein UreD [Hyphomicrobiaceae bacterium]